MSERAMKVAREIMSTPAQYYLRAANGVWYVETEVLELKIEAALDAFQPEWMDISTAPKDGTAFLAFGIHTTSPPDAQRGVQPGDHWWAIILYDVWRKREDGGDCWVFSKDGKYTWSPPSHWQPLPAPPQKDATDE